MYFMFCVTLTALVLLAYRNFVDKNIPLIVTSLLLLGVAITLVTKAMSSLKKITHEPKIETTE
jgi:ABC-type microcin C transport system permease subunit YejB